MAFSQQMYVDSCHMPSKTLCTQLLWMTQVVGRSKCGEAYHSRLKCMCPPGISSNTSFPASFSVRNPIQSSCRIPYTLGKGHASATCSPVTTAHHVCQTVSAKMRCHIDQMSLYSLRTLYSAVSFIVSSCVPLNQPNQALSLGTTIVSSLNRNMTNLSSEARFFLY